jgi:hypothetical protein
MKLNILADQSGRILGAYYVDLSRDSLLQPGPKCRSRITSSKGQFIHEIDLPHELHYHVVKNSLAQEIFNYRVESHDGKRRLVKISEK